MPATSEHAETEIEKIHHWRLGGIAMGSRWLLSASLSKRRRLPMLVGMESAISPRRIRTRDRRTPITHLVAREIVTKFSLRTGTALSNLDAALRLAAQDYHEIRAFSGFGAWCFIRDDEGRSRRDPGDTVQHVLWNYNPVERALCTVRVRKHRLNVAVTSSAGPRL